jgi:phosphohistidine phosphatase
MLKQLYIIRHAKSDWTSLGQRDFDRPLNPRGLRDAPLMAAFLKTLTIVPDLIVSSPANRALTTAQFFANEFGIAPIDILQIPSIYECGVADLYDAIHQLPDSAENVFLFAHNPSLTFLANEFTDNYIANLPTCGVVKIKAIAPSWQRFNHVTAKVEKQWFPKEVL